MNNELSHLYNLASVFSERLDTPQALLLAGESYRSIYEMLSNQTPSGRNGKKGFTDYSQAYPRLGIPVSLVSCDDTGAMQLAIMRRWITAPGLRRLPLEPGGSRRTTASRKRTAMWTAIPW